MRVRPPCAGTRADRTDASFCAARRVDHAKGRATASLLFASLLCLALAACGEPRGSASRPGLARRQRARPGQNLPSRRSRSPRPPVGRRADADAAAGLSVNEFAGGLQHPRWLLRPRQRRCAGCRKRLPRAPTRPAAGSRASFQKMLMKKAGSGHRPAPTASPCCAMPTATESPSHDRSLLVDGLHSPFGMALVGGELFVANADALVAFPFALGQTHDHSASRAPSPRCRRAIITTGPNRWSPRPTAEGSMSASVRTAMSAKTAWKWNKAAPRSGRSTPRPAPTASSPAACATRSGSPSTRGAGSCGPRSTNATSSAATSSPITLPRSATAASTAGRTAIIGQHVDARLKPPRPDLVAMAIKPDYALGPHTASLGLTFSDRRNGSARASPAAPSSASTDRGTASRLAATASSSCPSRARSRRACRSKCSTGFMIDGKAYGRPVGVQIARDGIVAGR